MSYDDPYSTLQDTPLAASASPGLATLPPVDQPAQTPQVGLGFAQAPAAAQLTPESADQQYLQGLPTAQKIGLAMQAFSAGMSGAPNPVTQLLQQRQQARTQMAVDLERNISTLQKAYSTLDALPPGSKEYSAFSEMMKRSMPQFAEAFDAHNTGRADKVRIIADTLGVKEASDLLVKASGGDPKEAQRLLSDSDFVKNSLLPAADQATLPSALNKVRAITQLVQQAPDSPFRDANGGVSFTMSDLTANNKKLPAELQLSNAEMQTLARHSSSLVPYGFKTDAMLIKEQEQQTASENGVPKMRTRISGDQEIQEEWDAKGKSWKQIGAGPRFSKQIVSVNAGAPEPNLSSEALKQAAARYNIDGTLPTNLGRGQQGAANISAILNMAADTAKGEGKTPEEVRVGQIGGKTDTQALGQLSKQKNLILAFEKNAVRNADIVLEQSAKVDRTGSPAINRWLQAGRKNIAGDAEVAKLDAAMKTFANEYARITTSVTGGGVTSDTARKEIDSLLNSAMNPEQVKGVVDLMKREMENRRIGYEQQEKDLKRSIGGGGKASTEPAGAGGPYSDAEKEKRYQAWKARQGK